MTTPAQLDERYGHGPRKRLPMIIGAAVAIAVVGVFGWWTVQGSIDAVDVTARGFELTDAHTVTVSFQFSAPTDRPVHCILEAQDEEFGIVGWKVIAYPATDQRVRSYTERIPVVGAATTGLVNSCWVS